MEPPQPPRKTIKLPSGLEVTVRRPGPLAIRTLANAQALGVELASVEAFESIAAFVTKCVIEPRLSLEDPAPEGRVFIDDVLTVSDFNALTGELVAFAGLATAEAEAAIGPLPTSGNS